MSLDSTFRYCPGHDVAPVSVTERGTDGPGPEGRGGSTPEPGRPDG